jgi:FdhD protein
MPRNSAPAQPPASIAMAARTIRFDAAGSATKGSAEVVSEAAVNIVYGTLPYAVMMATPSDLEDFVTGFSLTEGIIRTVDEIRGITITPRAEGIVASVDLAPGRFREHLARRRNLSGRTSCGLCGVESLADIPSAAPGGLRDASTITPQAVAAALEALETCQPLHRLTRSVHAAAWCGRDGSILAAREDVGRHNALDKLIGARLRAGATAGDGFVLVTSRASFEMVEKTAIFGASTLVAVSAPTSLAVERARALGMTLVAVARRDGCIVFTGDLTPERETAFP